MHPTTMKEIRGEIRNWLGVCRNESVVGENRIVLDVNVLTRKGIHFVLQLRGIFDESYFCVPGVLDLAARRRGFLPYDGILLAEVGDKFVHLSVHIQFRVHGGKQEDVPANLRAFWILRVDLPVSSKKCNDVDGNEHDRNDGP